MAIMHLNMCPLASYLDSQVSHRCPAGSGSAPPRQPASAPHAPVQPASAVGGTSAFGTSRPRLWCEPWTLRC